MNEVDILRSAVVFTHASLEEFLRTMIAMFFPFESAEALENIPLQGQHERPEKFGLKALIPFQKLQVEELLRESVRSHLYRKSFNDTTEIINWLRRIGLTLDDEHRKRLGSIDSMIQRRHSIVHNADLQLKPGKGSHRTRSLSREMVKLWIDDTRKFMSRLLYSLQSVEDRIKKTP